MGALIKYSVFQVSVTHKQLGKGHGQNEGKKWYLYPTAHVTRLIQEPNTRGSAPYHWHPSQNGGEE